MRTGWLILLIALAGACDKGEASASNADKRTSTGEASKRAPNPPKPEAKNDRSKPLLLDRLRDFAGRAEKGGDSVADIEKLLKEGQTLMDEVSSSDDKEIVTREPVKKAMAQLTALGKKKQFLDCAAKETAKDVSTCVDEIFSLSAKLFWENEVLVCRNAVELSLESGANEIAESDACKVAAPSFAPLLKMVRKQSAGLAKIGEKRWLKKRNKALGSAWKSFTESDAAKNYWSAVGESLHKYCSGVEDGELNVQPILLVDKALKALGGEAALAKLPTTSYKKILKDRDSEKGGVMKVRGKVLSITKDGDFYRGQLIDGRYRSYMFVTSGSTEDIYEDSTVVLKGVVTQIEHFETQAGGSNMAPVIVGFLEKSASRGGRSGSSRACPTDGQECSTMGNPALPVCSDCCHGYTLSEMSTNSNKRCKYQYE